MKHCLFIIFASSYLLIGCSETASIEEAPLEDVPEKIEEFNFGPNPGDH